MEVTRKGFISSLGATLVVATGLPADHAFAWTLAPQEPAGVRSFARLTGSTFYALDPGGRRVPMVLRAVTEGLKDPLVEQFSLVFALGGRTSISSGTYNVDHSSLGSFYLFLAASGRDGSGRELLVRSDFSLLRV